MLLFQNAGLYPSYRKHFDLLSARDTTFMSRRARFLADRYGAAHLLKPVLDGDAFFTNGDDEVLQRYWASERGLPRRASLEDILLAQIEDQRAEVFYNLDPMRFGSAFVRRLPGSVRCAIAWRAAPSPGADFGAYHRVVCNFESILHSFEAQGLATAYFAPAHDPEMDRYAANQQRAVDVLFVGGYSRHHAQRAKVIEHTADLEPELEIRLHLDSSRLTRLSESWLGQCLPLKQHRRPPSIARIAKGPLFGLELYEAISKSKIVLNGAIDMAGKDRGNMRCFEAMGCGALLVSDAGIYPPGMKDGENLVLYQTPADAVKCIRRLVAEASEASSIAHAGYELMKNVYNKSAQWAAFQEIVSLV